MFDRHRPILIALTVAGAFFMENLDGTVIATALPQMARSFGTSPINLSVGMTAYILALAVFIPISGWTADRFGSRSVFGAAIVVFTLTSLLCGASNGVWSFTAARVAQGNRRRHDGAGRPAGRAAQHGEAAFDARHGIHHLARPRGAGDRAAGRRLYHHLCELALGILAQPAAWRACAGTSRNIVSQ